MKHTGRLLLVLAASAVVIVGRVSSPREAGSETPSRVESLTTGLPPVVRMVGAEFLWLRAIAHLDAGRFEALLGDVDLLLGMTGYEEFTLSFWASELATTVARHSGDPAIEKEWFEEAVLRLETGLRRHPASSILHARLGEIHLDLLTRDPRLSSDFLASYGRSPAQAALEHFGKALARDGHADRWIPEMVVCRFLIADELLLEGDPSGAREAMRGVLQDLESSSHHLREDPVGHRFLDRASLWLEVLDGAVLLDGAANASRAEAKRRVLELLDRLVERYPEDVSAVDYARRLRDS